VVALAQLAGADPAFMRLKWIGWVKLTILAATALIFAWYYHAHPAASIVHGLVVLLVLADPVVTLWFNTLAPEFSVIWGLYAVTGAACALAISERNALLAWLLILNALAAIAFSRQELGLLAPLAALAVLPWIWSRLPHVAVVALGVALVCGVVSYEFIPRPVEMRVGVPDAKLDLTTAYRLARSAARLLPATQALEPRAGTIEGKRSTLTEMPWWASSALASVAARIPSNAFAAISLALYAFAPLAALVALAVAQPSRVDHGAALLLAMMLGGIAIYSLGAAVAGGDAAGAARRYLPGALATFTALVALPVAAVALVWRWWQAPKKSSMEMVMALGAIGIIACVAIIVLPWAAAQPLAIGAIEKPETGPASHAGLQVRGWALDPFGVEEVRVKVGAFEHAARFGAGADTGEEPRYPGYPDAGGARFALDLTAADLEKAGQDEAMTLRVYVKSRAGPTTELGARELSFAP
jgi:hypothetical protein